MQRTQHLESLGVLAGGIAHDFNNLLTGILGFIEVASAISTEPEVKDLLKSAGQVHSRARGLTRQLLTFSKGGVPARKSGHLAGLLRHAARFATSGANVACHFDIAEDLRPCSHDETQIAQVIDNIVINAVQAMPMGGSVEISAANITLRAGQHATLPAGDYLRIAVRDQGVGIPQQILARIFDPFFTTKQQGSGLGLAMAHSIIRRHDGFIDAESTPGVGSTFTIYLPAATTAEMPAVQSARADHRGHGKVLLMEDEDSVVQVLRHMLGSMGYECLCAKDGDEAKTIFARQRAAGEPLVFAILDLTIPGGRSGIEVGAELRNLGADMPMLATSGYSDDPAITRPREFGFAASLAKPFTQQELASVLSTALGARP